MEIHGSQPEEYKFVVTMFARDHQSDQSLSSFLLFERLVNECYSNNISRTIFQVMTYLKASSINGTKCQNDTI